MSLASTSLRSLTVLTQDDGVPGSKFESEAENYTVDQLKRWLKCRGLKLSGKRDDLVKRVKECLKAGKHHTLDPSIDEGKWFAAKVIKENCGLKQSFNVISVPEIPAKGWRDFPSCKIPQLFNYGHIHYYTLESIRNVNANEEEDEGLGHMTDKPLKNGRKYVNSGFVHDLMDTVTAEHYLVRAHVWPSMKNELPHNVVVVLSVNSGAVIHASCEPCRISSLGRCSHVVAVLFTVLDYAQKHGSVASKPCTSQECSWNKGKKRNKNPRRISDANYDSKVRKAATPVIDFDPRPAKFRQVTPDHISRFVVNLQCLSQNGNDDISMWETQLKITYCDYDLTHDQSELLSEKVTVLLKNIKPEACSEVEGTQQQSLCEKWFSERWFRVTASKCLPAFKIGRLMLDSQPSVAVEAFKFISKSIWGLDAEPLQTYWMRYGLESEAKAIDKYESVCNVKVRRCGLWVNPKFPFLGCSPDGLVNDDTIVEIKALKILKEYSVESVTSPTTLVPKHVLKRQCFVVKDGKCVLKRSHSYFYQCQQILLVTERKYCDFILYAENGPDSVERISRDEALIAKILEYVQALWLRVIAPEIFEMRVPRDLLPFVLQEFPSTVPSPESPEPIPVQRVEPSTVVSPANPFDVETPTSPLPTASVVDLSEPDNPCEAQTPTSPTTASEVYDSYTQDEIQAAEALLCSLASNCRPSASTELELTVFPWGGMSSTGVRLSNTCPLDNWLMIFQALVKSRKVNLGDLLECGDTIATALRLIDDGQYADAKLLIIQSLQRPHQVVAGTLDLYGNEGDYFLMLLSPYLTSTVTSVCCLDTCPSKLHTVKSMSVVLPRPADPIDSRSIFSKSLDDWQHPRHSNCGRKFSSQPSDQIPFYEDVTLNENGNASLSWHCAGTRVSSPRTMLDLKTFVIFSVDLLSRGGLLTIYHTPQSIFLYGNRFKLFGATLWNGGHYICMFYIKSGWYLYDGLKEYTREGSGISFSRTIFNEPLRYTLSYLVYCV